MKWGPEYAQTHDLSSLRVLGTVGEPINPEAWVWYREHIGGNRTPVVDTWWQTETGMILITPLPGITTLKPGSATKAFPTIDAAVYNDAGETVPPGGGGYLVIRKPWPAMLRGIYGDPERYQETYWSRWKDTYFVGDGARVDEEGDFWLLGRVDDVMNVSGHRISTIEVESALVSHPAVAEAAAAGRNDAQTGQAIVAFVTLKGGKEGSPQMLKELRDHVGKVIGKFAAPSNIVFTPELPKTRSGKIMRRLLRDVSENRPLGDTTTLADPAVVAELARRGKEEASKEEALVQTSVRDHRPRRRGAGSCRTEDQHRRACRRAPAHPAAPAAHPRNPARRGRGDHLRRGPVRELLSGRRVACAWQGVQPHHRRLDHGRRRAGQRPPASSRRSSETGEGRPRERRHSSRRSADRP
jgi:acetyl-CoA synthetase